jgi:hypothetical protein
MATAGAHCHVRHCARSGSRFWTHLCLVLRFFTCYRFSFARFSSSGSQSVTMIATGLACGTSFGLWWSILLDGLPSEPTRRALPPTGFRSLECFGLRARPSIVLLAREASFPLELAVAVPPSVAGEVPLLARVRRAQHGLPPSLPCVVFFDGGFPESERAFRLPRAAGHLGSCGSRSSDTTAGTRCSTRSPWPPLPSLFSSYASGLCAYPPPQACPSRAPACLRRVRRARARTTELGRRTGAERFVREQAGRVPRRGAARQVRAVPARSGVVVGVRARPVEAAQGRGRAPGRALRRRPQREPPRRDVRRGR